MRSSGTSPGDFGTSISPRCRQGATCHSSLMDSWTEGPQGAEHGDRGATRGRARKSELRCKEDISSLHFSYFFRTPN